MNENARLSSNAETRSYRGGSWGAMANTSSEMMEPSKDGSYNINQLEVFFNDLWYEPEWRSEAEIDVAYYDGDQLSQDTLRKMKENGILPVVMNFSAPAIDAVCGLETITRRDLRCISKDDDSYEVALALNAKFKEATTHTRFHHNVGQQYKKCVTMGLSWLEVSRQSDPFKYPYQVVNIPWREIFVDHRSREANYSDARYIIRRKWFDQDTLLTHFPSKKNRDIIKMSTRQGGFLKDDSISRFERTFHNYAGSLSSNLYAEERWSLQEDEWMNNQRNRVGLLEVLYFVPRIVEVIMMRSGHVIQLNRDSEAHLRLLQSGQGQYRKGPTKIWRQAYFIGSERLVDRPLKTNMPHYVPMVGYRKDDSGAPYALMRRMRSPQENINAKWARINYDLSSRKFYIDEDAVDDIRQTAKELNKATSFIPLKSDRRNERGIIERPNTETTNYTFQLLQESKSNLFDVTGLHPEFMGQIQSAGQSGVAIGTLIEQSAKVLGVILENYSESKLASAKLLFQLIVADMINQENMEVGVEDESGSQNRRIILNARGADGRMTNELLMARIEVELEPTPMSETYRQQTVQSLTEVIKSMPEEMQAIMMDLVVRASQLPQSEEILERIRELTGYGPAPKDPQKRQQLQEQQQAQQELQQKIQEIQMAIQEAEIALTESKAESEAAKTQKLVGADTDYTEAKTLNELAKAETVEVDQTRKDTDSKAKLIEASGRLRQLQQTADKPKSNK